MKGPINMTYLEFEALFTERIEARWIENGCHHDLLMRKILNRRKLARDVWIEAGNSHWEATCYSFSDMRIIT